MFIIFKYFIYFLIFLSLLLFYFLFTPLGHSNIYYFLGKALSKKNNIHIEVQSINIINYPNVNIELSIKKRAKLTLKGHLDDTLVDMKYTLRSDCVESKYCKMNDNVDIHGGIKGHFNKIFITGKGKALDGNITYKAIKYAEKIEDFTLNIYDANSTKLINLLGKKIDIKGKTNANVNFSLIGKKERHGNITLDLEDKNYKSIPIKLHVDANISNDISSFMATVKSTYLSLDIFNGSYNQVNKQAKAFYLLDIKELHKLKKLLGQDYKGSFYARGEMTYKDKIKITGLSKSFGGLVAFAFEDNLLKMKLKKTSLIDIVNLFSISSILKANIDGDINYNFKHKRLDVHSTLNNAKFLPSTLVNVIKKKSNVNMMNETFNNSKLDATYQHNVVLANLKLINKNSHVNLTSANINTKNNTIDAYFDFKMQHQEFSGKVYGSLDSPKVNLDMQKLVRYQMDKQVDKIIGESGRKLMENLPMGGVAKDVATDMGASFIKIFF